MNKRQLLELLVLWVRNSCLRSLLRNLLIGLSIKWVVLSTFLFHYIFTNCEWTNHNSVWLSSNEWMLNCSCSSIREIVIWLYIMMFNCINISQAFWFIRWYLCSDISFISSQLAHLYVQSSFTESGFVIVLK